MEEKNSQGIMGTSNLSILSVLFSRSNGPVVHSVILQTGAISGSGYNFLWDALAYKKLWLSSLPQKFSLCSFPCHQVHLLDQAVTVQCKNYKSSRSVFLLLNEFHSFSKII